jgi:uncharacterized protein with ParB-like and HNH nuclease domain
MGILYLLEQIDNNEIVLPAIQRDFIWSENQIEKLMDSIMRSYPIGIIFLWETYEDIQYREFIKNFKINNDITYHYNSKHKRLKLVLDGQQRLQSLFVGIHGKYEDKSLYFDILSGKDTENFKEDKYSFDFFLPKDADRYNEKQISLRMKQINNNDDLNNYEISFFCRLKDLISMGAKERQSFERDVGEKYKLSDDDKLRLSLNLTILHQTLTIDTNILRTTVLDENKPRESPDRKTESDVLEAFVRINREGTPLSRSDLIFSMLKLNWGESATTLPDFVDRINEGNSFELDSDFVIRCLFAVSNLGTRFDIDILRKKSNIKLIKKYFEKCCDSIKSTIDFVQNQCWIASSKLIKSYYNLVPIVYYLFNIPNYQVPNAEIVKVRKALYLFGFTSPFSRYAESRLSKFIREDLKPLSDKQDNKFPLDKCYEKLFTWENVTEYDSNLLQKNPSLALHLVQRLSGINVHYEKNTPQIDHIFPKSVLKKEGYKDNEIDCFANYWILTKNKNQNKYSKPPIQYFADVDDSELKRALINRELLDYGHYKEFIKQREHNILEYIKNELAISESTDFPRSMVNVDLDDF